MYGEFMGGETRPVRRLPVVEQCNGMLFPNTLAVLHTFCDFGVAAADDEAEKVPVWTCCGRIVEQRGVEGVECMEQICRVRFKVHIIRLGPNPVSEKVRGVCGIRRKWTHGAEPNVSMSILRSCTRCTFICAASPGPFLRSPVCTITHLTTPGSRIAVTAQFWSYVPVVRSVAR